MDPSTVTSKSIDRTTIRRRRSHRRTGYLRRSGGKGSRTEQEASNFFPRFYYKIESGGITEVCYPRKFMHKSSRRIESRIIQTLRGYLYHSFEMFYVKIKDLTLIDFRLKTSSRKDIGYLIGVFTRSSLTGAYNSRRMLHKLFWVICRMRLRKSQYPRTRLSPEIFSSSDPRKNLHIILFLLGHSTNPLPIKVQS